MKKKTFCKLSFLPVLIILISCSKNEDIKRMSSDEITNFILVNEQLPIKTLSNALEWPEEVIIGVDLGLIKLNENGEERLNDIFEDYSENGKDNFIKDNNKKEWSAFIEADWINSVAKKISKSKLDSIKKLEFKNNAIIQDKLNNFIPKYVEKQTKELSRNQFSFFSIGFWKNLGQVSWIHTKSTFFGKFYNWNIKYIEPIYQKEFQLKWEEIYNSYFSLKEAEKEIKSIAKNYQELSVLKHNYILKIKKISTEKQPIIFLNHFKLDQKNKINTKSIISQFNLSIVDNLGLLILEFFLGIFAFAFIRYILINFFYAEELKVHHEINNFAVNLLKTPTSPIVGVLGIIGGVANGLFYENKINNIEKKVAPIAKNLKIILGLALLAISIWYFPKKQIKLENEINRNLEKNFVSNFNKSSILILDELNLSTEIFYTSI